MKRRDELRATLANASSERLWWTWRFLESALRDSGLGQAVPDADLTFAVDCFVQLASADAEWATAKLADRGPEGHGFAKLLDGERLDTALASIRLPQTKVDAMLRARILIAVASWKRPPADAEALWARAWTELQRVEEVDRGDDWKDAALAVAAHAAYDSFKTLVEEKMATTTEPFWRAVLLAGAIPVAARVKDWTTFDGWIADYRALPEPFRRDHDACAIMNLEGIRAMEAGRDDEAERIMEQVLAIAPAVEFLSNDEVSALSKRLRAEGRALALCDQFDALTQQRDWRLLTG